jgi:hypothetical protein
VSRQTQAMLLAAVWLSAMSLAAAESSVVRSVVELLLGRLQASACRFKRNGSWYSGRQARDHLTRKLNYLAARNRVNSAEQFIELGASASSFSGRPYLVQCADQPAVRSRGWLLTELQALRGE